MQPVSTLNEKPYFAWLITKILAWNQGLSVKNEIFRSLLGEDLIFVILVLSEDNLSQRIEMRHPGKSDLQELSRVYPRQKDNYVT